MLPVVCGHLARLDCLLLAGVTEVIALRAQRPVWVGTQTLTVPAETILCSLCSAVLCGCHGGGVLAEQAGSLAVPYEPGLDHW